MLGIVAIIFFVVIVALGTGVAVYLGRRDEARETLRSRLDRQAGVSAEPEASSVLLDRRLSSIRFLNEILSRSRMVRSLALMTRQAGLRRRVGEVLLYIPLLGSLGVLGGMWFTQNIIIALALGGVALLIPLWFVDRMRKKRVRAFSEQLPDALDLMKAALQAGHSFLTALKVVADDFPEPIANEFDTVAEEIRHGLPMRDALMGLEERVPDSNVPMLVIGILVTQESGGNLVEVLGNVSHTIRERFKLMRDVETMTSQGRLSGMMLSALPILVSFLVFMVIPGYYDPVFATTTGHYMIAYCIVSIITGHLVIQRMVQIKV